MPSTAWECVTARTRWLEFKLRWTDYVQRFFQFLGLMNHFWDASSFMGANTPWAMHYEVCASLLGMGFERFGFEKEYT